MFDDNLPDNATENATKIKLELVAAHFVTPEPIRAESITDVQRINIDPETDAISFTHNGQAYYLLNHFTAHDHIPSVKEALHDIDVDLTGDVCARKAPGHDKYNFQDMYLWYRGDISNGSHG